MGNSWAEAELSFLALRLPGFVLTPWPFPGCELTHIRSMWPWGEWLSLACLSRAMTREGLGWEPSIPSTPSGWEDERFSPGGGIWTAQHSIRYTSALEPLGRTFLVYYVLGIAPSGCWLVCVPRELIKGRLPVSMNCCPFEGWRGWIKSTCQQVAG